MGDPDGHHQRRQGAARPPRPAVILRAVPFDEEAEQDLPEFRPPPHPDDRVWRHPSEIRAHPIMPIDATPAASSAEQPAAPGGRRPWGAVMVAGAAGAVLAAAGALAFGLGERVVERPVVERVALSPVASSPGSPGSSTDVAADGVRRNVAPSVVGVATPGAASTPGEVVGSGVVVRDDGIVVTSASLLAGGSELRVRLPDGTWVAADVVGSDPASGLGVLDLAGSGYTPSVLAAAGDLVSGETSFAVSAREAGGTATAAGVVGVARRFLVPSGGVLDGVEVEGPATALALGGPLVDARGAVVGITTTVEDDVAWYVMPVEVARNVTDDLLTDGYVRDCWLGIEGSDVPAKGSGADGDDDVLDGDEGGEASTTGGGTRVMSVMADSPAADGDLQVGDVVVALDGHTIARMADLMVALRAYSPGDRVDVTVNRDTGSRVTLMLTLAGPPAP
jgi:S1-C subfamily serine protease